MKFSFLYRTPLCSLSFLFYSSCRAFDSSPSLSFKKINNVCFTLCTFKTDHFPGSKREMKSAIYLKWQFSFYLFFFTTHRDYPMKKFHIKLFEKAASILSKPFFPSPLRQIDNIMNSAPVIAFIGGGNMAEAILGGLYNTGHPQSSLRFSEPLKERLDYMKNKYPQVMATDNNDACVEGADIVILAVKPQVLRTVVVDLAPTLYKNPDILIVSIAAGIESEAILRWLNASYQAPLVRIMPNTPALIGEGAVGLFANPVVTQSQRELTERLLGSVSKQLSWVETESLIDTITGVSGSGSCLFFLDYGGYG